LDTAISLEAKIRRRSLIVLPLISALLILARAWLSSGQSDSDLVRQLTVLLDNLSAAAIFSTVAALFLVWQTRSWAQGQPLLVRNGSLGKLLSRDAFESRLWLLRARTGSYFVRETLPRLAKAGSAQIRVILLDPGCAESVARYEADKTSRDKVGWTAVRIQADIVVSIIRISQYVLKYPNLNVEARYSSGVWVQSLDISERSAFLCGQESGDRALVSPRKSELYRRFEEDFQAAFHLSKPIELPLRGLRDVGFFDPSAPIDDTVLRRLSGYFSSNFDLDVTGESLIRKVRDRSIGDHHYSRSSEWRTR